MNGRVLALVLSIPLSACDNFGALDRCSVGPCDAPTSIPEPCPSFAIFCDGFESGNLSKWTGTVTPAFEAVESTIVHTGHYALESDVPMEGGNGAEGAVYLQLAAPATGTFAVREYVFSTQPVNNYMGTLFLTDSTNPNGEYGEVIADDVGQWTFTEESATGGLHDHTGSIVSAGGVWTCIELVLELGSGGSNNIELFIDRNSALTTPFLDPNPTYDNIAVGVTRAVAAGFTDYVDDIVVANQRIGC